ncbi:type I restriction endonuclease subunit R [Methanococcus maripaludis]|uniref:type I site-specific deoxyribonuclease n=1 Tax=Methanococcus maripaludis TaxID=39152 RepID=A0A7J9PTM9_METMI|nr:HsdR family type I site-specific deoxyribonuclease [Methanococcus maripaludis]MBA2868937.1 type I restriction enzyme R subunit [Methanococcus maripaludis]
MLNPDIYGELKVQKDAIKLLKNMGYVYISKEENRNLRINLKEVILKDILKEQLNKLNSYTYKGKSYKFSEKSIENAISDLDVPLLEGLSKSNEKIYDQLILGNDYPEYIKSEKARKSFKIRYIDWETPENNVFHVTEEFSVEKQDLNTIEKTKRADLVLFVNGIPFGIIELKKSSVNIEEGISQLINYQNKEFIPHLYRYIQVTMAGNPNEAKYATTKTAKKFWSVWKENDDHEEILNNLIPDRIITKLDKDIYSFFNKNRFLELVYSYTIFDANIKKIARFQQYFAIKKTLKSIEEFDATGKRKGGLIWHTQGSGKSLTMVMLAKALKRKINNSKIIVVTDRKSLDKQIESTFSHAGFQENVKRAKNGKDLVKMLKENKDYIITTIINKFASAMKHNVINNSENVFILVDEGHRSQHGDMHTKMKFSFPRGCYIGFTGTPLMKKEKNSFSKFGGMIHKYTMDEAVSDKAVVPLLYEGRLVPQEVIGQNWLDKKFEIISKNLLDEQKVDLKRKWARFQKVASSERRLEAIAIDINEHFRSNFKNTAFNAILATNSKFEALRYHKIFEEYGDIKTAFVISPPDMKEGVEEVDDDNKKLVQKEWKKILDQYGNEDDYEDRIKDSFLNGELDLLIVVDKLLTGFDAPRATVLYVDKELKDHKLLQAIARVNRLYDGKDFGYIIDYRGLLGNLDRALTSYSSLSNFEEMDLINSVIDIKKQIELVKTYYSHLSDMFKDIEGKESQEYEVYLADEKLRQRFYNLLKSYSIAMKTALTSEKIYEVLDDVQKYKRALKFYSSLRSAVSRRYQERIDFGEYEEQMQKLLDSYIGAGEVDQLTKPVNIFDAEKFNKEVLRVEGKRARADIIRSGIEKQIKHDWENNPEYYQTLSERIKDVLEKYLDKRITEEEYFLSMQNILKEVRTGNQDLKTYPNEITENNNAKAIYDNIYKFFANKSNNGFESVLGNLCLNFDLELINNCKVDWSGNPEVHNLISQKMDEMLWDIEDKYDISVDNDKVIETVIKMALRRYGN